MHDTYLMKEKNLWYTLLPFCILPFALFFAFLLFCRGPTLEECVGTGMVVGIRERLT